MPYYTVTEPHPTVAQSAWTHAGRGGAGNHFRAPPTTSPQGIPTPLLLQPTVSHASTASSSSSSSGSSSSGSHKSQRFYSGRGGAGNAQRQQPDFNPVTSFEDEFSRADTRHRLEMGSGYHVGRGGAGNFKSGNATGGSTTGSKKERQGSASSGASCSSSGSSRSSILSRLGFKC